jgi:Leucine rich repeat
MTSLKNVIGDHRSEKSSADVKQIYFGHGYPCGLTFVPQDIHKHFPNIIGIGFNVNCNIQSLTGNELKDYVNLEWFTIRNNSLDKIPASLFQNNPNLKYIDFSGNKISKVGSNLLTGLEQLTTTYFNGNVCINKYVHNNRTGVLEVIEELEQKCSYPEDPNCATTNMSDRLCKVEEVNLYQQKIIEDLKKDNTDLQGDLESEKKKVSDLKGIVTDLQDRLSKLEAKMNY